MSKFKFRASSKLSFRPKYIDIILDMILNKKKMDYQREFERISDAIGVIRNITLLLILCAMCSVCGFLFIPGVIPQLTEIYIISVGGCILIFMLVALILARKSSTATLFFTGLSQFFAGIFLGIAFISIQKII